MSAGLLPVLVNLIEGIILVEIDTGIHILEGVDVCVWGGGGGDRCSFLTAW